MNTASLRRRIRYVVALGMLRSMLIPFTAQSTLAQKTTVYPGGVVIERGTCVNGVFTPPVVTVPSDTPTDGIQYFISQPDASGNFSIEARSGNNFSFGDVSGTPWEVKNQWNLVYTGVATMPDCDDASSDSSNLTAEDPSMGVFAMPQDCGTAPYPAPTGSDVTNNIVFSNYVLTQNGVPHVGGPIELSSPSEVLTLSFDWLAINQVSGTEHFSFTGPLDTSGNKVFTSATQWFPVATSQSSSQTT